MNLLHALNWINQVLQHGLNNDAIKSLIFIGYGMRIKNNPGSRAKGYIRLNQVQVRRVDKIRHPLSHNTATHHKYPRSFLIVIFPQQFFEKPKIILSKIISADTGHHSAHRSNDFSFFRNIKKKISLLSKIGK